MKPYPSGDFLFLSLSTTYSRNIDIPVPKASITAGACSECSVLLLFFRTLLFISVDAHSYFWRYLYMMHFCRSHLRIYLICSLSGFGNNCHSVTGCHRPAAVCSEDCHHPLLHSTHHLWRHSQSGPACQQYVHLLHVSKHRSILSR